MKLLVPFHREGIMYAYRRTLVLMLVAALPALAVGQSEGDKTLALMGLVNHLAGPNVITLATKASVKAEIELTAEQEQQIKSANKTVTSELRQQQPELFNDKKKGASVALAIRKAMEERVIAILTPKQLQRVQQIQIQLQAYNQGLVTVFSNKSLRERLGFTAEQNQSIKELAKEHSNTITGLFRGKEPGRVRATLDAYHAKTNPKIMALLTAAQQDEWNTIIGKPFDFVNNHDLPIRR